MKTLIKSVLSIISLAFVSCTSTKQVIVPLSTNAIVEDTYTIIWNGTSQAYRYINEKWERDEKYDYIFDVVQKRYDNKWKSIKNMHRIHPDYDGKAGDRDQTMYFEFSYDKLKDNKVPTLMKSSLGAGEGLSDKEFRDQQFVIYMENSNSFSPYNKIKITQQYKYEEGLLIETVELLKEKDGKDMQFMKNEEQAFIYIKGKLNNAPTILR